MFIFLVIILFVYRTIFFVISTFCFCSKKLVLLKHMILTFDKINCVLIQLIVIKPFLFRNYPIYFFPFQKSVSQSIMSSNRSNKFDQNTCLLFWATFYLYMCVKHFSYFHCTPVNKITYIPIPSYVSLKIEKNKTASSKIVKTNGERTNLWAFCYENINSFVLTCLLQAQRPTA